MSFLPASVFCKIATAVFAISESCPALNCCLFSIIRMMPRTSLSSARPIEAQSNYFTAPVAGLTTGTSGRAAA